MPAEHLLPAPPAFASGCRTALGHATYEVAKRSLDILLASILIVGLLPVLAIITILVRLSSPGPILFKHARIGKDGRAFMCLKFRSMVPNAELILSNNEHLRAQFQQQWKLVNDPRITPIGAILRKSSLDELPQLWNVLRGDMSLVGPRPVLPTELSERYGEHAATVISVRPGMTGLWQVSGRSSLTYEQRVQLDIEYVRRRNIWFDILIVLQTIPAVFGSQHAV